MRYILLVGLLIQCCNVVAQQKIFSTSLSERVQFLASQGLENDSLDVIVVTNSKQSQDSLHGRILYSYPASNAFLVRTTAASVSRFTSGFMDIAHPAKVELTTGSLDLATNFVNLVHDEFPSVTGEGVLISFKENRFDTADLDLTGRYVETFLASPSVTAHATIMATTAAGAGNSSPFGKGAAPRARITSSSFTRLLPDPDTSFSRHGITVQNHSYGTIIQNYYGAEANAYDVNARLHPTLVHVFSSGNSGAATSTSGMYSGIPGIANLTGNFKYSKNTISVGAIDSFYNVASLSSKGPAPDGRIKPELVAFGQDGSSGAAAMVSGTAVLLQHAYKNLHGSQLPPSSLVKAVLINSAKDVDVAGIDFNSGYGSLNAYDAVKTVMEGRTIHDSLQAVNSRSFPLFIPSNAALVKITLAWTDPAAPVNSPKALVNDLDLTLQNIGGASWLPWVLNTRPHIDSLRLPATRGRDTLNNVEFITVADPPAGNYSIQVNAQSLVPVNQAFSIAYQIDTLDHFLWTFPGSSDALEGGKVNIVRWQSNRQQAATLEYSLNGGAWTQIASIADARKGFFEWITPDTFSVGLLRMRFAGRDYVSDTFVINQPISLQTGFDCSDSFMLYWNRTPATLYQVYHMNGSYLEPAIIVADTFHIFNSTQFPSDYFAIAPIIGGKPGLRGNALKYWANGVGCYFRNFYLQFINGREAHFFASIGSLYQVKSVSFGKLVDKQFKIITTINDPQSTDFNFVDPALTRGQNTYRLQITLQNGQTIDSDVIFAYYFGDEDVIVYPNPVRRGTPLTLLSNKAGRHMLKMYSASGMKVFEAKIKDLRQILPVYNLPSGIYFLHVIDDEERVTVTKVVVL